MRPRADPSDEPASLPPGTFHGRDLSGPEHGATNTASASPARQIPGLSWRQLVVVDLIVLAAFAVQINHRLIPGWVQMQTVRAQIIPQTPFEKGLMLWMADTGLPFLRRPAFQGFDTLVVGDSAITGWPWRADFVWVPGSDVDTLLRVIDESLGDRHYKQIVLWHGSWNHHTGLPLREYEAGLRRLLDRLTPYGDTIKVIGPMPRVENPVPIGSSYAGVPVLSLSDWFVQTQADGRLDDVYYDGLHLVPQGFKELKPLFENFGIVLDEPTAS